MLHLNQTSCEPRLRQDQSENTTLCNLRREFGRGFVEQLALLL